MDYRSAAREQLALEYGCAPEDFVKEENLLTLSQKHEGCRRYRSEPYFFQMATLGHNAVLTADARLHPFLRAFIQRTPGFELFHQPNLWLLQQELLRYGYTLAESYHMFLPRRDAVATGDFAVRWYLGEQIEPFRADGRFPHALDELPNPDRPDRIAVAAYDGDRLMGLAACSEDAPHWMQIGVDVIPGDRGRGVATHLVMLLKNRILANGDIPFYGTSLSNYGSWNTALAAGFAPAFVEQSAFRV